MSVRIIVLDVEPVVRSVLGVILRRAGYVVEPMETFQEALEAIKSAAPDLLLTNVYLPGIAGREAIQRLKDACPELPVLMVSGLPDEDLIREWVGRDGFDTFPKPFTAQELLYKVRTMLTRKPHQS